MSGVWHRFYAHADHQGSIVSYADDAANLIRANAYDPWGIRNQGDWGRFAYTGQLWIADLDMYYYKARIYSPMLGRFLQTDPIGYGDQVNLYAYVHNDPLDLTDPRGEQTCWQTLRGCEGRQVLHDLLKGAWDSFWGTDRDPRPPQLSLRWLKGDGPNSYFFGPDSINTQDIRDSYHGRKVREMLYAKYQGHLKDGDSLPNYQAKFGLGISTHTGYLTTPNMTEQFVGSFRIDAKVVGGRVEYRATNTSSFTSFLYGIGPNWERARFRPMGNMRQTYFWTEPVAQ